VFTFAAENHGHGTITAIWGYFRQPGEDHEDDLLETGCLEVPARSPIARMARQIAADPDAASDVEAILRASITACPCTPAAECPAVDEVRLLGAMEHATGTRPGRHAPAPPAPGPPPES